jgi:glycosyltransferase involved in cell wall biosynthesis
VHSLLVLPKLPKHDLVYAPSDYFCDVIPAVVYKYFHPQIPMVSMVHHLCRSPFQRKGNFILNTISYISQRFSFWLITLYADKVFVYDTPEGKEIGNQFLRRSVPCVLPVANGVSMISIDSAYEGEKIYDACFVGGLRASKGVFDLIGVWKDIVAVFPKAKLAIIGEGAPSVTQDLKSRLSDEGLLGGNVILLGAFPSNRLYEVMKSSKVFISTSHEEGWGIAVCEALACGLPVIAYSLPAFGFLNSVIDQVALGDQKSVARRIVFYLKNDEKRKVRAEIGREFIKVFSWDAIAQKEYSHLHTAIFDRAKKLYS